MAVMIDTSRAPRTPEELAGLVQAVLGALPADELDWIEWKASMDLADKRVEGTIARHVLGMANRLPADTQRHVEGRGYLVIGAEPGNPCGVTAVDPSQLSQGIQPYLGSEGQAWSPQYVQEADVTVLVIVVEPPEEGDHIFTLQNEFTVMTPAGGSKTYLAGDDLRPPAWQDRRGRARGHPGTGTALRGPGQGMEVFAAAARANVEIQAAMRNVTLRAS
jgi:hypothetical protein